MWLKRKKIKYIINVTNLEGIETEMYSSSHMTCKEKCFCRAEEEEIWRLITERVCHKIVGNGMVNRNGKERQIF